MNAATRHGYGRRSTWSRNGPVQNARHREMQLHQTIATIRRTAPVHYVTVSNGERRIEYGKALADIRAIWLPRLREARNEARRLGWHIPGDIQQGLERGMEDAA